MYVPDTHHHRRGGDYDPYNNVDRNRHNNIFVVDDHRYGSMLVPPWSVVFVDRMDMYCCEYDQLDFCHGILWLVGTMTMMMMMVVVVVLVLP